MVPFSRRCGGIWGPASVPRVHSSPPAGFAADPALYRQFREQITRFYLRGGDVLSLRRLEALGR